MAEPTAGLWRLVAAGGVLPPLHGVPFTVKENIDLAGIITPIDPS